MYTYPLKFEFPFISFGRQVDVTNGDGRFIIRIKEPFPPFKDAMTVIDGRENEVLRIKGDSILYMSWAWNITTPDGAPVVCVDDRWVYMEEFMNSQFDVSYSSARSVGGVLGEMAKSYANTSMHHNTPRRLVYELPREQNGEAMGWIVPSRGTGWFDFLPYRTRKQILNLPFASRVYAPSYELKVGNLASPTVLKLQKERDLFVDRYILHKVGELTDQQERWAIPALALSTMFERSRIKKMTD